MPDLPATAAWRHVGAREGFEVLFLGREGGGYRFHGHVTAVEEGQVWSVYYTIDVDSSWSTRRAHVAWRSLGGEREVVLEGGGSGKWSIDEDGAAPELTGILDVDLEASPGHRLTRRVAAMRVRLHSDLGSGLRATRPAQSGPAAASWPR